MRITNIECIPFSLPFRIPFRTANAEYKNRKGLLLVASTDDAECVGFGELAPLEEFSSETLTDASNNMREVLPQLQQLPVPSSLAEQQAVLRELEKCVALLPSVGWAIDMLLCDIAAKQSQLPLCEFVDREARSAVPINGILGGTPERMLDQLCQKVGKGYPVYKVKIRADQLDLQIETLAAIRSHLDRAIPLRLDCNQSLDYDTACEFLNKVARCGIEYAEEPLREPTPESMQKLRKECPVPLALDETLEDHSACMEMLDADCFDIMVLKPMLLGGIGATQEKARIAADKKLKLVLTSTLESGVGLSAGVHTAASVPAELLPCGFDTAGLFSEQIDERPLAVVDGAMQIPQRPGLGVVVKQDLLPNNCAAKRIVNA